MLSNNSKFTPSWLKRIYRFNQHGRDLWVKSQAAKIPEGSRVLDVGAGSAPYRNLFAHCEYKTHDFAKLESEQLLDKSGYSGIDYVSDILSIPVRDASFDAILCTEVLEHVPRPIDATHELARILKPGGKLILTAPLGSGLHQEPFHFYGGYTPHWYKKFLPEAGFENIVVEPSGGFFKHYGQESVRFVLLSAPWRNKKNLVWLPLWIFIAPWLALLTPLLGYILDYLDDDKAFTVEYHVTAVRS